MLNASLKLTPLSAILSAYISVAKVNPVMAIAWSLSNTAMPYCTRRREYPFVRQRSYVSTYINAILIGSTSRADSLI